MSNIHPIESRQSVSFPDVAPRKKDGGKKGPIIALVLIFLFLIAGGVSAFVFRDNLPFLGNNEPSPTPTPFAVRVTETPIPEPTTAPTVNKADVSIDILNGTGTAGDAGLAKAALEKIGFSKVTTGNASTTGSTSTSVSFSSDIPEEVQTEVKTALEAVFSNVAATSGSGTLSIKVTTGPKSGAVQGTSTKVTATPTKRLTATPTPTRSGSGTPTPTKSTTGAPTPTGSGTPTPTKVN